MAKMNRDQDTGAPDRLGPLGFSGCYRRMAGLLCSRTFLSALAGDTSPLAIGRGWKLLATRLEPSQTGSPCANGKIAGW